MTGPSGTIPENSRRPENAAPAERLERRMQNWFTATESYPRQLHEMDRASYLAMKRAEVARQNSLPE
ncbi:MAG: hypothetical protein MZW92_74400 [Comamonadaceae bacterium]|nr:hypothetical protein [Comamonadaceae bacterium]